MSDANSTESAILQKSVIAGILGVLGIVLVVFGAVQADTISIAVGGGAVVTALATYSAMRESDQ
jgi:uncharacterized membrane protein YdfJ with MMPL/SSD domain